VSGKPGRSGRKPLPVALHLARGTFRPDRHGARLAAAQAAPLTAPAVLGPIPPKMLEGLGEPGRQFLADKWVELAEQHASVDASATALLRLGATLIDDAAVTRRDLQKGGPLLYSGGGRKYLNPLVRHLRQIENELIAVLKELEIEPEE
jgi:hypothetical protein